jgi:type VI secretion system protein ImpK
MNSSITSPPTAWMAADGTASDKDAVAARELLLSNLPDVFSGGNPLVAAANQLLNLIPQIRAMVTNDDPRALQQLLLEQIQQFERRAGASGVPMETIIGARYCLCTVLDECCCKAHRI